MSRIHFSDSIPIYNLRESLLFIWIRILEYTSIILVRFQVRFELFQYVQILTTLAIVSQGIVLYESLSESVVY